MSPPGRGSVPLSNAPFCTTARIDPDGPKRISLHPADEHPGAVEVACSAPVIAIDKEFAPTMEYTEGVAVKELAAYAELWVLVALMV